VIAVESAGETRAASPKGAQGLMQLIPETARRFGVRDPFDAAQNLRGGMEYLHWLLREFRGNVTFALAAFIFIGVTLIGFYKHGFKFLKLFVPSGVPLILLPLIVVIEIISYFTRPLSLSVRLFANMMAGHTMLAVFGSFVVGLGILGGWLPFAFMVVLMGLEILIAFLQAYVFAVLTCIYLSDALHPGH